VRRSTMRANTEYVDAAAEENGFSWGGPVKFDLPFAAMAPDEVDFHRIIIQSSHPIPEALKLLGRASDIGEKPMLAIHAAKRAE
jgi:hypothetical protein